MTKKKTAALRALEKIRQGRTIQALAHLQQIQQNTYEGHAGRIGQVGGSLPRGKAGRTAGSGPLGQEDRPQRYQEKPRPTMEDTALDKTFAKGGVTIKANGLPNEPTTGYCVARHPERGYIVENARDKSREALRADVRAYVKKNQDLHTQDEFYLGLWINNENGALYFDTSSVLQDLDEAKMAGVDADQIAIWDIANEKEIPTGGSGEKGIESLD
jgi:hypothetical protein